MKSVLLEMGILLSESVLLFAILCVCPALMTRAFGRKSGAGECNAPDKGFTAERLAVEKACVEAGDKAEYALVINGLSRFFGEAEAVKDASLAGATGRVSRSARSQWIRKDDSAQHDRRHRSPPAGENSTRGAFQATSRR
ncbi:hypothetical protein MTO96_024747 [Rhipicephalus appendiculatus]